jgi:TolB-like protein/Tfp pilus assembly protein PilF
MNGETTKAVFLSYASQDAGAARNICEALRGAGIEVWFDQSELRGGDSWDQKIRKQIRDCALFIPIVSANTQARREGYFRLEWKLADDRTHLMARGTPFLLPVCIDDTKDWDALVPDSFMSVQWVRLRDGATTAAFCERVKSLLVGVDVGPAAGRAPGQRPGLQLKPTSSRIWLVSAIAVLPILAGLAVWQPWRKHETATALTPRGAEAKPVAPLSEARQLTLKARALIDDDFLAVRENFRLAEELCLRATTLDPADGEAWATLGRVSVEVLSKRYDTSPRRLETARSQVERAIRLAPQSVEARLAMASYRLHLREWTESEKHYQAVLEAVPNDPRAALGWAAALRGLGRNQEATEIRLNHPAFGGRDPRPLVDEAIPLREKQFGAAEALFRRSLALAPTTKAYLYYLNSLVLWVGDLEAARTLVETIPAQVLQEDAVAVEAARLWIWLGDGRKALAVLDRIPRDFLEEFIQIQPKGYMKGRALKTDGRDAAAQAEWRQAISVLDARLAIEPNRASLLSIKAELLACTGQVKEGDRVWALLRDLPPEPVANTAFFQAKFFVAAGRTEEAIRVVLENEFVVRERTYVRLDPLFVEVRRDSRVKERIATWEAELATLRKTGLHEPITTSSKNAASPPVTSSADAKSVAVLAFTNSSDDKSNEYFSDGISEELLNLLAKIPGLKVTARTSAFHFKGKDLPIPEIAKQLGVAHVVEGSVRKAGTQLRIAARLLNGADGTLIWSDDFREELKDVFALQDKIAGHIAKNLTAKLGIAAPRTLPNVAPTKDLVAYDAYLRGRALQTAGHTRPTVRETVQFYQDAVRRDPGYALAWARLTHAFIWLNGTAVDRSEPNAANARDAAEKAVRLGDDLPEAHLAMAAVRERIDHDYVAAQRHVDRAERLRPNNPEVFAAHARLEFARGNWGAGLATLVMRSVELDPQNVEPLDSGSRILLEVGRFAEAEELLSRWSRLAPTLVRPRLRQSENHLAWTGDTKGALERIPEVTEDLPRIVSVWITRALVFEAMGDMDSAKADYERRAEGARRILQETYRLARLETRRGNDARAAELYAEALALARQRESENPEDVSPTSTLALVHAALGQRSEALAAMAIALQRATETQDASRLAQARRAKAEMLGILGDVNDAVAELQAVHAQGYGFGYSLRRFPRWDPLRGDPKFQQLMKDAEGRADAQPRPKKQP